MMAPKVGQVFLLTFISNAPPEGDMLKEVVCV